MTLHRNSAQQAGVGQIFDRVLSELSLKMRTLNMDSSEYVALKAIILLNPGQYYLYICGQYHVYRRHLWLANGRVKEWEWRTANSTVMAKNRYLWIEKIWLDIIGLESKPHEFYIFWV